MKRFLAILFLLSAVNSQAADQVIATISVTNAVGTTNGNTIVINGSTRTWTNNVTSSPSTLIQVTNSPSLVTTQLLTHLGSYTPGAGISAAYGSSTSLVVRGVIGSALTITVGGGASGWATVSFSTNVYTNTFLVRVPITTETTTNRTNIASLLVKAISDHSTNYFATNAVSLTNYLSRGPQAQVVDGPTIFRTGVGGTNTGLTNGVLEGTRISNAVAIVGTAFRITNGVYVTPSLVSPYTTNLTNYGLAISSQNPSYSASEQFGGGGASVSGMNATVVGYAALANKNGTALGAYTTAGTNCVALGGGADSTSGGGYAAVAIGQNSNAGNTNSIAIGYAASALHSNSVVIGALSASTASDQITLGSAAHTVKIAGLIAAATQTNSTFTGTNQWTGDLAYPMYSLTTLANGNNLAVPFTNVLVAVSGPSAAFTINGIYGGRSGREVWLINRSGQAMTIANESGVDPTPANRITLSPAADAQYSDGQLVHFLYDGTSSRWRGSVPTASVTNSLASNSANFTIVTNDWVVNTYYTNAAQRAYVSATLILTATVTANAKVALYLDQDGDGTWEQTGIAAQTGLGLATADWFQLGAFLQPSARFMYTNLSTGAATASVNGGSSQWVKQ